MSELISDPAYWKRRLREASTNNPHHAIFKCDIDRWKKVEEKHRLILADKIGWQDSILDAGCAWGRLLDLLPGNWMGYYLGVDVSPDFIELAKERHPNYDFVVGDLREFKTLCHFDWAIMVSVRPMVRRNLNGEAWSQMEAKIRQAADKLLYLEYDPNDEGSVE